MGTHRLPTISPVYTKSYYQAHVDGKADGRFRKFAYQLVSNPEFAVVQYLGDSSVARENPRKRSPSSFDGAVAARKKTGNHSRKTDKLKVTQVRCNRRVKKKLTESPIDDEHINVAVDYLSENSETEAAVVEETPEALARATVEEGRVVLVPSMQVWIVRDVQGRKFMTELFPFINCSCGSSNCFHILTAALSCGYQLPIPNQPRP